MDLGLTPEQEDLQLSARRFVRDDFTPSRIVTEFRREIGFDRLTWKKMADLGWLAMAIPEARGGVGASAVDVAVLYEEFGRGPLPGPLFETGVVVPKILLAIDHGSTFDGLLSAIATGAAIVALALSRAGGVPSAAGVSSLELSGGRLHGRATFLREAAGATHVLSLARSTTAKSGWAVAVTQTATSGVDIMPVAGYSPRVFSVTYADVAAHELVVDLSQNQLARVADAVLAAVPVGCAYQVGSAEAVYEMTVRYSRDRVQFGKPIGTFQRVQDHIIDLVNGLDSGRWTTYHALSKIDHDDELPRAAIHVAKVATSEGHYAACTSAHEVHAGIGTDIQYGLAVHTFASRTLYSYLGDPAWHRSQLAGVLQLGMPGRSPSG